MRFGLTQPLKHYILGSSVTDMQILALQNKIFRLTKTNSTSYPNADLLDDLNIAYNDTTADLFLSDGRWQWDDTNQTDLPVATAALVSGQQDYTIPGAQLIIDRVEILPQGGNYFYRVLPRDVSDPMWGSTLLGIDNISQGAPIYYDISGTSILLYPIPGFSQAASIKVYFRRAQVDFTAGDLSTGTIAPGFASLFHDILAYKVAYDYAIINIPQLATGYWNTVQLKTAKLKAFYALRERDDSPRMSMRPIRFR